MTDPWASHVKDFDYDTSLLSRTPPQIRLLCIHPATKKREPIFCEVVKATMRYIEFEHENQWKPPGVYEAKTFEKLEYSALSWNWKDTASTFSLRVHMPGGDETRLAVTPNLYEALRMLRDVTEDRFLWVDAVCINQRDRSERSHQVRMMDEVYSMAESVSIWLGPSDEDTEMAVEFIEKDLTDIWNFGKLCRGSDYSREWIALAKLVNRDWFYRRWIIQELVMARTATVHIGKFSIAWKDLANAVRLFRKAQSVNDLSNTIKLDHVGLPAPNHISALSVFGAITLVEATSSVRRSLEPGSKDFLLSLETLVTNFNAFKATEPRDTIYAVLGMARDASAPLAISDASHFGGEAALYLLRATENRLFEISYEKPVITVFKDFMRFAMQRATPSRALDIMFRPWAPVPEKKSGEDIDAPTYVSDGKTYIKLPSWMRTVAEAPLQLKPHPIAGGRMERVNADPLVGTEGPKNFHERTSPYSACGPRKQKDFSFLPTKGSFRLTVEGFELDEVVQRGDLAPTGNIPKSWFKAFVKNDVDKDPRESLWRTLVADIGSDGGKAPEYYMVACEVAVREGWCTRFSTLPMMHENKSPPVIEFLQRTQEVVWNRRLVELKSGRKALAPESVTVGDKVCILFGCSVPVFLRRYEKTEELWEEDNKAVKDYRRRIVASIVIRKLREKIWLRKEREKGRRRKSEAPRIVTSESAPSGLSKPIPDFEPARGEENYLGMRSLSPYGKSSTTTSHQRSKSGGRVPYGRPVTPLGQLDSTNEADRHRSSLPSTILSGRDSTIGEANEVIRPTPSRSKTLPGTIPNIGRTLHSWEKAPATVNTSSHEKAKNSNVSNEPAVPNTDSPDQNIQPNDQSQEIPVNSSSNVLIESPTPSRNVSISSVEKGQSGAAEPGSASGIRSLEKAQIDPVSSPLDEPLNMQQEAATASRPTSVGKRKRKEAERAGNGDGSNDAQSKKRVQSASYQEEQQRQIQEMNEYWTVVGDCYLHDMMNGQAITYQSHNRIKTKRFELR